MSDGEALERAGIDSLVARYSDAVNRRDEAQWAACWAEHAVWHIHGRTLHGRDAIVGTWRTAMAGYEHVWFMAFAGQVVPDGNEASLFTHTFEYLRPVGGAPRLQSGLYEDRVVRQAGGWVFASRSFTSQELPL